MSEIGAYDVPARCEKCGDVTAHRRGVDGALHCMRCVATNTNARPSGSSATTATIAGILVLVAIVLGIYALVRAQRAPKRDPGDVAGLAVKDYAFDAYTQWAGQHPTKTCPDRLEDLNEYMNVRDTLDPWGNPYRMSCGASLPAGVRAGIAVMSLGPDGKEGTDDDIRSWE